MPGADNQTIEEEQRYRASAYALLAGLLRAAMVMIWPLPKPTN